MNIAAFIARRIAFNKQKSFSRFIIRLSMVATIISVMVMIMTLAFASGFQKTISEKVFSFWGHIRVQSFESARIAIAEEISIKRSDSVERLAKIIPEIRQVQAFATMNAILKTPETIEGVLFKGVEENYDFNNLKNFLVAGRWIHFSDSGYSSEINLSAYTAGKLNLKVNDKVLIYFIQPNAPPRPRKLTVAGIYKTGIEEYDKLIGIGDLKLVQRLNNWAPDEIGGYEIFLHDYRKMDEVSYKIVPYLPIGLQSTTIVNIFPNIFDWLALQDKTIAIVLIIMVAIAILNLVTCLLILALERTRMVGILKALGARIGTVREVFLYQGAIITISGLFFGNLVAFAILALQKQFGFITLPEEAYYISEAAVDIVWWQVALVNLGTLLICLVILFITTYIVKRMSTIKAIQFR